MCKSQNILNNTSLYERILIITYRLYFSPNILNNKTRNGDAQTVDCLLQLVLIFCTHSMLFTAL